MPGQTIGTQTLEQLANVTNGTDGTYSYYVDKRGYRKTGLQFTASGGSGTVKLTLEATMQQGADHTALTYVDITSSTFGVSEWTASDIISDNGEKLALYTFIRWKVVASTGGANDADWRLDASKTF